MLSLVFLFALLSAPVSGFFFAQSPRYQATLVRPTGWPSNVRAPFTGIFTFERDPANNAQIRVTYDIEGFVAAAPNTKVFVKRRKLCNFDRTTNTIPAAGAVNNLFATAVDPWVNAAGPNVLTGVANTRLQGNFNINIGLAVTDLLGFEMWLTVPVGGVDTAVGCGLIGQSVDSLTTTNNNVARLPGVANNEWGASNTDFIRVSQRTSNIITVEWMISNLMADQPYIARLHRGGVCPQNAADINLALDGVVGGGLFGGGLGLLGGGLFGGGNSGGISFSGVSSVGRVLQGSVNMQGTLQTVFNRVFVLYRVNRVTNVETRIGCITMGRRYEMTEAQLFPGVAANTALPSGTVAFEQKSNGIYTVQYSLSGLPANAVTSLSINGGLTCRGTAGNVGAVTGLYLGGGGGNPGGSNPFGYALRANANGFAAGAFDAAFTDAVVTQGNAPNMYALLGHTVVINSAGFVAPYNAGAFAARAAAVPRACGKVGNAYDTTTGTTAATQMVAFPGSVAPNVVAGTRVVSIAQFTAVPETIRVNADIVGTNVNFPNAQQVRFSVRAATSCAAPAAANLGTVWQGNGGNAFTGTSILARPPVNTFTLVPTINPPYTGLSGQNAAGLFTRTSWESMRGHAVVVEAGNPLTNRMCGILSTGGNTNNNMLWLLWLLWGGF